MEPWQVASESDSLSIHGRAHLLSMSFEHGPLPKIDKDGLAAQGQLPTWELQFMGCLYPSHIPRPIPEPSPASSSCYLLKECKAILILEKLEQNNVLPSKIFPIGTNSGKPVCSSQIVFGRTFPQTVYKTSKSVCSCKGHAVVLPEGHCLGLWSVS